MCIRDSSNPDFDENTQVLVTLVTNADAFNNINYLLRQIPVLNRDLYGIIPSNFTSNDALLYSTTPGQGNNSDTDNYIWVTPGGKVVTNSTLGVLRFRKPI